MNAKIHAAIRRYVVRHSPKQFATVIKARNAALLRAANGRLSQRIQIGCPHCHYDPLAGYLCNECLWTRAIAQVTGRPISPRGCVNVEFGGIALRDFDRHASETVYYSYNGASYYRGKGSGEEHRNVVRFLRGHLSWASRRDGGADIVGPAVRGDGGVDRQGQTRHRARHNTGKLQLDSGLRTNPRLSGIFRP